MEIVHAQEADLPGIRRLLGELTRHMAQCDPQLFVGAAESDPYTYSLLPNPDVLVLVAKEGEKVVGLSEGLIQSSPPNTVFVPRRFFVLHDLVVAEGERGKGIGEALLSRVQEWTTERGIPEIELNIYSSNPDAIRFYESQGFKPRMFRMVRPAE